MNRRQFLKSVAAGAVVSIQLPKQANAKECGFEICRSDADWKQLLTKAQYKVMRRHGTERSFSSPLDKETRKGTYYCRGCDLPLYESKTKFDSGTGWPSFYAARKGAIGTQPDRKLLVTRTEIHCRRCGSHLGHMFDDGPAPTGKRHCLNGVSLVFRTS